MTLCPPNLPPKAIPPRVEDVSSAVLGHARREKSSSTVSVKLCPRSVVKKHFSHGNRRPSSSSPVSILSGFRIQLKSQNDVNGIDSAVDLRHERELKTGFGKERGKNSYKIS
ncbi:hypothetical protein L1887_28538 [Cichorium endivia]|nr:hypothetical protein L1887_28538 [Cichorium endivia]